MLDNKPRRDFRDRRFWSFFWLMMAALVAYVLYNIINLKPVRAAGTELLISSGTVGEPCNPLSKPEVFQTPKNTVAFHTLAHRTFEGRMSGGYYRDSNEYRRPIYTTLVVRGSEHFRGRGFPIRIEECLNVRQSRGMDSVVVPRVIVNATFAQPVVTLGETLLPPDARRFLDAIAMERTFAIIAEVSSFEEDFEGLFVKVNVVIKDFWQIR